MIEQKEFNESFGKERHLKSFKVDDFIKIAVENVLFANKRAFEAGKTVDDGLLAKVVAVDDLEALCIGFGVIKVKVNDEDSPYVVACKNFLKSDNFLSLPADSIERKVKFANFRFKLILSCIRKTVPVDVELDF
ncbi:MAG: hypothetical protein QXI10_03585 [Candidatus Diapherotrites archaeon]